MQHPRTLVLNFFRKPGARVAISRTTLSRVLSIAFPTLDAVLAGLERDGYLERHPIAELEQWRTVRGFDFGSATPTIPSYGLRNESRQERLIAQAKFAEEKAARLAAAAVARAETYRRKTAEKAAKEARRAEERRLVAEALARWALAEADAETVRKLEAVREAAGPKATPKVIAAKITLPEFDSTYRPPVVPEPVVEKKIAAPDPWAKIRARANAKPVLLPSSLRTPTDYEKMTGRVARRA